MQGPAAIQIHIMLLSFFPQEVGTASAVLQVANVPFSPHSTCRSNFPGVQASGQFCAGKEGVDSCNGDSGGPLILFGSDGRVWKAFCVNEYCAFKH